MAARKKPDQTTLIDDDIDELEGKDGEDGERIKRSQPLDVKNLPEGVRAILRLKPWRDVAEYSAYIYRKEADPTKPGRIAKKFCERIYNTEIEESWLKARYPRGGRYAVIYQVPHPTRPGDVQIHADDFEIEPDMPGGLAAPNAGMAPLVAAPAAGGDLMGGIANLRALAEVVSMLQGNQPAAPAAAPWLEKMYQEKIRRLDELEDKMQRKLSAPTVTVHNNEPADELAGWPDFLRPFAPQIKAYGIKTLEALAGKLMGSGLEGAGLRFLVLNNPHFKALWSDPVKREAAAAAIIGALGEPGENLVRLIMEQMGAGAGGEQ